MTRVYLDYNSTTPVDPGVAQAMMTALTEIPGNPSNTHWFGREAKEALERARQQVADLIRAEPDAIFFTGSGTEADNWAIKGIVAASGHTKPHVICSPIEHDAILRTCEFLSSQGVAVSYVEVDETGLVDPGSIE
ncbi:MAG: aminotransferase class V-fold PLP-dependent enzyme, partial [candidate division WOR-3 bacterium]